MSLISVISGSDRSIPNAPTIGTATDVGTGRAFTPQNGGGTVTFTAPTYTGRLPILDYTVTSSPSGFTGTGAGSPVTVNGLAPNTNYTFTVTARNSIGSSAASAASNTMLSTTVPQAPTIGTATDAGTGTSVVVPFTANATGGKAISSFTATSSPGGLTATGGSSPLTVTGLTAGTAYTFTVTATNANGTSLASAASNSVTPAVPTAFDSIATFNGNGSTGTVTFNSIPGTYRSLQLRISVLAPSGQFPNPTIKYNNDSNGNYTYHWVDGYRSGVSAGGTLSTAQWRIFGSGNLSMYPTYPTVNIIDIIDYASTSKLKTSKALTGVDANTGGGMVTIQSMLYNSTAAITRIDITSSSVFPSGSIVALYGIK